RRVVDDERGRQNDAGERLEHRVDGGVVAERQMDPVRSAHGVGGIVERLRAVRFQRARFFRRAVPDVHVFAALEELAHEARAEQTRSEIGDHRDGLPASAGSRSAAATTPTSCYPYPSAMERSKNCAIAGSTSRCAPRRSASSVMRRMSLRAMNSSQSGVKSPFAIAFPRPPMALFSVNASKSACASGGVIPCARMKR